MNCGTEYCKKDFSCIKDLRKFSQIHIEIECFRQGMDLRD